MLVVSSITIVALVTNSNIWISRCLSLTDLEVPWSRCINGQQSIEWRNQSGSAIGLKQDTIQDWASHKRSNCCSLGIGVDLRIEVNDC